MKNLQKGTSLALPAQKVDGNVNVPAIMLKKPRKGKSKQKKIEGKMYFIYLLFIYLFTDLFIERACPQLAKANLGGPCLNKQITKKICIYNTDKN